MPSMKLQVTLTAEQYATLRRQAEATGLSMAEVLRMGMGERGAVVKWLRRSGPGGACDFWGIQVGGTEFSCSADGISQGEHRKGEG